MSDEYGTPATSVATPATPAATAAGDNANPASQSAPQKSGGNEAGNTEDPYKDCYSYTSNNQLVYTDPATKSRFILDKSGKNWIPYVEEAGAEAGKPDDNPAAGAENPDYDFDGKTYGYTDKEGNKVKWNLETKAWDKTDPDSEPEKPDSKPAEPDKTGSQTTKEAAESSEESELDSDAEEKMTPEEKRQRAYKKRKVAPGLVRLQLQLLAFINYALHSSFSFLSLHYFPF